MLQISDPLTSYSVLPSESVSRFSRIADYWSSLGLAIS